ncbi:formyltransferase family protein [Zavarzinella formosa]|uniref:formyltransferase family protein n=1 Tax=Zavarzinella formosa TaxID=360055 RepID=UPI001930C43E|nr:formyltransferase family protein [Zavarzinella formosa]
MATIRPWNLAEYENNISKLPGRWTLITEPRELTVEYLDSLRPRYVFFPHWSHKIPPEIIRRFECVCFHQTDLPYGRGGSPMQNLIERGHEHTMLTALRMTEEFDAGPVYLKRPMSLHGLGEEIFLRVARTVTTMIAEIIANHPEPVPQSGEATVFKRRTPAQSQIPPETISLEKLFDHLRMLDVAGYPPAFLEYGNIRLEFSRPALRTGRIEADVKISILPKQAGLS